MDFAESRREARSGDRSQIDSLPDEVVEQIADFYGQTANNTKLCRLGW